jgi:L-rhamnose-H+ transport protein
MSDSLFLGVLYVCIGGVLIGLFSVPITKTPRWSFEQIWGVGSLFALLFLPWPLALLATHDLARLYSSVPANVIITLLLCGIGWGIGGIFWGKAIEALGMALGISLLLGLVNISSSVAPFAIFEPTKLTTSGGLALIAAVGVMLCGITLIALAGKFRHREQAGDKDRPASSRTPFWIGLVFCLLSGIPSALPNFAFIFGRPLAEATRATGASSFAINFPMWALVFSGNYLVNILYALIIMIRKGTWKTLIANGSPSYWAAGLFMGLAWPGGIVVYGIGAASMGPYGAYVGYPMMILTSMLAGNLAGALGGEWKGSKKRSRRLMLAGVMVVLMAFGLLSYSNRLLTGG